MSGLHIPEQTSDRQSSTVFSSRLAFCADNGPGITLALGGGFSRGFAHLGILEVLEQEGIPIASIVGTSIGALLGAAYADGISTRDLCDLGRRVRIRDFLRYQPRGSYPGAQKKDCISQFVQEWFHTAAIEDLSIPMSIVATDLETGAPYVFSRGPIEVAIRASCAFPGLVKPVQHEGHLLADGCIVAPVPSAIAAWSNRGCVLGVNVGSTNIEVELSRDAAKGFDGIFRGAHASTLEPSWRGCADVVIEPKVHHVDWSDFSRVEEVVAAGADAMRHALPALREVLTRQQQSSQQEIIAVMERGLFQ